MRVVVRQLRSGKRVERGRQPGTVVGHLGADRFGVVVIADDLPSIENVHLTGPAIIETVRRLQARLVVRRQLTEPRARVEPVVFRKEAFEPDMRRVGPGLEEKASSHRSAVGHRRLIDVAEDARPGRRAARLRQMDDFRAAASDQRQMDTDRLRVADDLDRSEIEAELIGPLPGRARSRDEVIVRLRTVRVPDIIAVDETTDPKGVVPLRCGFRRLLSERCRCDADRGHGDDEMSVHRDGGSNQNFTSSATVKRFSVFLRSG